MTWQGGFRFGHEALEHPFNAFSEHLPDADLLNDAPSLQP